MKRVDPAGLAAWADKREEKLSRALKPAFWGTVSDVQGQAGHYEVQVVNTGQNASDGQWHFVQVNGQVPAIGDLAQLQWQDDTVAVVTSILSTPRVVDQHNLRARLSWSGSASVSPGFSHIPYTNAYDPGGNVRGGDFYAPLAGDYLIFVKTGLALNQIQVAAAIYINDVEAAMGSQQTGGSYSEPIAMDVPTLKKGDKISGYVWTFTAGSLVSGADRQFMVVRMLSAA